jgi:hypothetical protein
MTTIISASRRTDLPAFFPEFLAASLKSERAEVVGPGGRAREVDLSPGAVHSLVLWSKDFSALIGNTSGLRDAMRKYDQIYLLFTITGLGGTRLERGVPWPGKTLAQLPALVDLAGDPRRVSLRFDPVVFWRDEGRMKTNLDFFKRAAAAAARAGLTDVRFSMTQWYGKALRRAQVNGLDYVDPPEEDKLEAARRLAAIAADHGLRLYACAQDFLARVPGVAPSSCIDGAFLKELHPRREEAPVAKDPGQRPECGCTVSIDIGSYAQSCAHGCLYCYANPKI